MALSIDGTAAVYAASGTSFATGTLACANAGNWIRVDVLVNFPDAGPTINAPTGGGVTFTRRAQAWSVGLGFPYRIESWRGYSSGTFNSAVTVTTASGAADFATVHAYGVGGAPSSSPEDTNASLPATAGVDPVSVSTDNPDDIIFGVFRGGTANPAPGSGYTQILGASGSGYLLTEQLIVSSTQSGLSVTWGPAGTANGVIGDAIMAEAGPPPVTGTLLGQGVM